jgi:FkbM family methyltransferase
MGNIKPDFLSIARQYDIRTVYDCGSRDALEGMELARQLKAAELHVFECNPDGIRLCRQNLAGFTDAKVFLNELAVCEREGELDFFPIDPRRTVTDWKDGNIGASSLYRANPAYRYERYAQNRIQVRSTSIDAYCAAHRPPDLLWLDLQGAEKRTLEGAARVLPQVKVIHVEVFFRPMYYGQALYWDVHRQLKGQFKLARLYDVRSRLFLRLNTLLDREKWFTDAVYVNRRFAGAP